MMPSLGLLLSLWCGAVCVPVAWTNVMDNSLKDLQARLKDGLDGNGATLEDEMENQENILTQLLGDYDKVKALSEGPDCRCKCVVRPLSRSACRRIEEGSPKAEDFYTVETVTSGSNCTKCACIAPPSALNPCEGDFRFKKLQEAGEDDIKLSKIMELLEGAFYGMDLLKLHSVTTKLIERVDNIEKSVSGASVSVRSGAGERKQEEEVLPHHRMEEETLPHHRMEEEALPHHRMEEEALPHHRMEEEVLPHHRMEEEVLPHHRMEEEALPHHRMEEEVLPHHRMEEEVLPHHRKKEETLPHHRMEEEARTHHRMEKRRRLSELEPQLQKNVAAAHTERKYEERFVGSVGSTRPLLKRRHGEERPRGGAGPSGGVIRGVTYYKASVEEDGDGEEIPIAADEVLSGDGSVELVVDDQLPGKKHTLPTPVTAPLTTAATAASPHAPTMDSISQKPTSTPERLTGQPTPPTTANIPAIMRRAAEERQRTRKPFATTTTTSRPVLTATPPAVPRQVPSSTALSSQVASPEKPKSRLSWNETPTEDNTEAPKLPGMCKDTLATIADPVTHNTYGRNEGAWMKDPNGNGNVIYVTNYYYGNNLLEFRDMDTFKQGRFTNSYKLPYNWLGTGHVVYGGAFYYNRAFSHDIIKFDLRQRYVAAWTTLHDATFQDEDAHRGWRGHSEVDFAVDESGLWLVYPALDEGGFRQEVVVLNRLNPADLQREQSWRTGLRRGYYGNCFVVCGVLYAVDSHERRHANVSYAFDTHTHTQMVPRLPFVNNYMHVTQLDYNPKDRMLYAWDNGHQVTYNVIFAY